LLNDAVAKLLRTSVVLLVTDNTTPIKKLFAELNSRSPAMISVVKLVPTPVIVVEVFDVVISAA
jgi:hypothetical protein